MKIILYKYKEIKERNCRELLCDFVLNDMNLIIFSNGFILYIIKEFSFIPECLDQNNTNSEDNPFLNSVINNQYYPLLDKINQKSKDKILEEYLKYIFKFTIFRYYKVKLSNRKLHSNLNDYSSETEIEIDTYFGEESYKCFLGAHNMLYSILNSYEQIPIKNIKKLFCISFCSFFLEKFVFYTISPEL